MYIASLPSDILILILEDLTALGLSSLAQTCKAMHTLVDEFGWAGYLRANPRPACSLSMSRNEWSPRIQVKYDVLADAAWSESQFIARPLSRPWTGKLQPLLAISTSRLIVAAGHFIYSYVFSEANEGVSPPIKFEGTVSLANSRGWGRSCDITGLTFVDDGGLDHTLYVGFDNGAIERITLVPPSGNNNFMTSNFIHVSTLPTGDFVEKLNFEMNTLLVLSSTGQATLAAPEDLESSQPTSTIEIKARSWASHLSLKSSTPYAAFGSSSSTPLTVYSIANGWLSDKPTAILSPNNAEIGGFSSSAVYGLSKAPSGSPWGPSPQILVSGWYDGEVRCYDLRSSDRIVPQSTEQVAPLRPVLSLTNPWLYDPIYSVSCGGGSAAHIAAGSSRHSVVSFWDMRSPKTGWSVHAPGNDPSPIYSVILESSRCFGATQSRPFVYDFGPGVSMDTYPSIPQNQDGLKRKRGTNKATCYVTKYFHNRTTS